MTEKIISPALSLPAQPIEDQNTALIPIIPSTGPMTPIPAAPETRPFFRGMMPLAPSTNEAYKIVVIHSRDGREIHRIGPTPELEKFKEDAFLLLARGSQSYTDFQILEKIKAARRLKIPLGVRLWAYFLTEWKRDLDGVLKFSIDAAFDYLSLNDNLVCDVHATKHVDAIHPRIEIEIRCLTR